MDESRSTTSTGPAVRRTALLCAGAAVALAALSGCSAASDTNGDARASGPLSPTATSSVVESMPPEVAAEYTITIEGFQYEVPEKVSPGAIVLVENKDDVAHTVTAEDAGIFYVVVEAEDEATFVAPDTPGQYPFICTFHAGMEGTLVVG
jgi:plastocyanin